MSDSSLNLSYTPLAETSSSADKPFWLRMVQVDLEDDTAMVGEVADLLDKIFEIEPCTQQPGDQIDKPVAPKEDVFNAIILREMAFAACLPDYTGAYEVEVKVYRSHGDVPYKLVALNGEFLHAAYHTQEVELSLLIDNAESVNLQHPVVDGFTYDWEGTVFDEDGACPPPEIERQENLVYFGKKVTGRLVASFKTEYDLATLIIHGENRTPQTGNLVAFYNHQSYEKDVEQPLVDGISAMGCPDRPCPDGLEGTVTCYETLHHYSRCECDGKESGQSEHNYETGPEEGTCPEKTLNQYGFASLLCGYEKEVYFDNDKYDGYVECDDNRPYYLKVEPDDPDYYYDQCGSPVPSGMQLPPCMTTFEAWPKDPATIERGEGYYRELFGPNVNVVFKPVYPRNGECGTWEKEYIISPCSPFLWMPDNPTIFNSYAIFYCYGGREPVTYEVSGTGFWTDAARSETTGEVINGKLEVYGDEDECGTLTITVTDGCNEPLVKEIKSTLGVWVPIRTTVGCEEHSFHESNYFPYAYGGLHFRENEDDTVQYRLTESSRVARWSWAGCSATICNPAFSTTGSAGDTCSCDCQPGRAGCANSFVPESTCITGDEPTYSYLYKSATCPSVDWRLTSETFNQNEYGYDISSVKCPPDTGAWYSCAASAIYTALQEDVECSMGPGLPNNGYYAYTPVFGTPCTDWMYDSMIKHGGTGMYYDPRYLCDDGNPQTVKLFVGESNLIVEEWGCEDV